MYRRLSAMLLLLALLAGLLSAGLLLRFFKRLK